MSRNDDFRIRPGRIRSTRGPRTKSFLAQALQAAQKAGGHSRGPVSRGSRFGRGRATSLAASRMRQARARGAMVKARVVRQMRSPGALRAHIGYLKRDGVTRDGSPGKLFDAAGDDADGRAFAERCEGDRHHFRLIVSPDDAGELSSLRGFTRELMDQASRDLGTRLDWVAVDHWNTEHPHIHILVRGRADDGSDLVISRDYIGSGLRARAGDLITRELGPRSELEVRRGLEAEVTAERWTRLDRALAREADENGLNAIFAFTYVPQFFKKLGFKEIERGELPLKAWKDCLRCPKFQACDEIAMLKRLKDEPAPVAGERSTLVVISDLPKVPARRI